MKPLSVNSIYYRNRALGYTKEAKAWMALAIEQLKKQKAEFAKLQFDDCTQAIQVEIIFHTPELYNKQGIISHSSLDIDNFQKPLIDLLFKPNINFDNFNIDDKHIVKLTSSKVLASNFKLEFFVQVVEHGRKCA